jgi:hypothetical protein
VDVGGWSLAGSFPFGYAQGQDDGKNGQQQQQKQMQVLRLRAVRFAQDDRLGRGKGEGEVAWG